MQRISSRNTFFTKRVFPVIWFGFLVFMVAVPLTAKNAKGHLPISFFLFPAFMAAVGYFILKKLVFDLADEVTDAGDALIVRFGSDQQRIPLSEISNISYAYMMNPPRVTLTLRTPSQFGKEVSFSRRPDSCPSPRARSSPTSSSAWTPPEAASIGPRPPCGSHRPRRGSNP